MVVWYRKGGLRFDVQEEDEYKNMVVGRSCDTDGIFVGDTDGGGDYISGSSRIGDRCMVVPKAYMENEP